MHSLRLGLWFMRFKQQFSVMSVTGPRSALGRLPGSVANWPSALPTKQQFVVLNKTPRLFTAWG